jgi:hypothetical protein
VPATFSSRRPLAEFSLPNAHAGIAGQLGALVVAPYAYYHYYFYFYFILFFS